MRILIAEDDQLLREFLRRSLKIDRHLVDAVGDGEKALERANKYPYDIIILDIVMPLKNGVAVCKELRANDNNTPIIFLTSRDSEASRVLGLDAGADDYLIKPFSYSELTARLRAITRRQTSAVISKVPYGNLTLDMAKRCVERNGSVLTLQPKEYALLEYLILHNGEAVTRQNILDKVWGVQALSTSNRLDVCVKSLRKKLEADPQSPKIVTVHSYGYRLQLHEGAAK